MDFGDDVVVHASFAIDYIYLSEFLTTGCFIWLVDFANSAEGNPALVDLLEWGSNEDRDGPS